MIRLSKQTQYYIIIRWSLDSPNILYAFVTSSSLYTSMLPKKYFHFSALIQELSCVWDTDITSRLFSPSPSHSRWSMVEVREKVQIRVLVAGMFVIMQQSGEFEQIWTSNFMEVVLSNRLHSKPISLAPSSWKWRSKWPSPIVFICTHWFLMLVWLMVEPPEIEIQPGNWIEWIKYKNKDRICAEWISWSVLLLD